MIINGELLLQHEPIKDMLDTKLHVPGGSYGLSEAGYDIRIKQGIEFCPVAGTPYHRIDGGVTQYGRFCLASSIEEFQMPQNLVAIGHDKSTWARLGVQVFNTVIEPGWSGFLTIELVFNGDKPLFIPAGTGIMQLLFHELSVPALYAGKYQDQPNEPVEAKTGL